MDMKKFYWKTYRLCAWTSEEDRQCGHGLHLDLEFDIFLLQFLQKRLFTWFRERKIKFHHFWLLLKIFW